MKFHACVILTDEELLRLTEASARSIRRDGSIQTKTRIYEEIMITFLFLQSTRLDALVVGNFQTTEGLRTDSPAGGVDSHNVVCSWCAQAHVTIHSCVFTNGYFQGQELSPSCCTVFQLKVSQKKELQAETFWPHVFPSTVLKMQDEELWLGLKNT